VLKIKADVLINDPGNSADTAGPATAPKAK